MISSHCEVRPAGGGTGKDSKGPALANVGRAVAEQAEGDPCYHSVLQSFSRLLKLGFSKAFFPFQGPLPMGLSLPLSLSTSGADEWGFPTLFYKVFFIKDFYSGRT